MVHINTSTSVPTVLWTQDVTSLAVMTGITVVTLVGRTMGQGRIGDTLGKTLRFFFASLSKLNFYLSEAPGEASRSRGCIGGGTGSNGLWVS